METPSINELDIPVLPFPFKGIFHTVLFEREIVFLLLIVLFVAGYVLYRAWKRVENSPETLMETPTEKFLLSLDDEHFLENAEAMLRDKYSLEKHWTTEECLARPLPSQAKAMLLAFRKFRY